MNGRSDVRHDVPLILVGFVLGVILGSCFDSCHDAHAQDLPPRPRPSRPIPPPTPVESFAILVDRSRFPQALRVVGTWQQPDGETSVYRHNEFIPSSGMGPGDHAVTEVDVPAIADLVAADAPDCNGGCGPYCERAFDLALGRFVCNCALFTFRPVVPARTSNGAEPFMVAGQTRRIVVEVRDRVSGAQLLLPLMVHDLSFTWADIGVFAAPPIRRRPSIAEALGDIIDGLRASMP